MAYVKNTWVDREGQTRYHETIDDDGALIFTPDYEKVTEIGTPVNADNMNHIEDGIVDHENRITVLEEAGDASNFLNKSQITNCITEIPQRIKYTLENGTFTLLKGSVMIFPHGTTDLSSSYPIGSNYYNSNFKVVDRQFANGLFFVWAEIQADKTISQAGSITRVGNILYVNAGSDAFGFNGDNAVTSGTTKPTSGQIWYDTTNNIFHNSSDGFATYTQVKISFPICTFAREAGVITNINQVFNGMGYIGSSQWYDKDIVGLSPNGLNSDGTYNNAEIKRTRLTVRNFNTEETNTVSCNWQLGSSAHRDYTAYYAQDTQPALSGNWLWYDTLNNKLYGYSNSTGLRDMSGTYFVGGFGTRTNGVVTSFNPKQTFRAVDYNDLQRLIDLEIGKPQISLDSNLPSSCVWLEGATVSRTTYANLFAIYGTTYGAGDGSTTFVLPDFRNRAIWGSNGFGYLSAGLPNITGKIGSTFRGLTGVATGAFTLNNDDTADYGAGAGSHQTSKTATFNASKSNAIYGGSTTVQPPAIKVRVYARYQ